MFFSSVASLVELYLWKFQSSKPMMSFVYRELVQVFHSLYSQFLKQEVIEDANTSSKLLKLDPKDPNKIWCDPNKVDTFVGASKYIKKGFTQKQIAEKQRKSFNKDCINFLSSMVSKLAKETH